MKKRIIILTTQRTGSTWLITLLNNYKSIQEFGEPFINKKYINNIFSLKNKRFEYYNHINANHLNNSIKNINKYIENLEKFSESNSIIFKIMYSQLKNNIRLIYLLFRKDTFIIHLKRKNIYESVISDIYSKSTDIKHILKKNNSKTKKIYIDINFLKKRKNLIMFYRSFVNFIIFVFLSKKTINVDYEELVQNKKSTLLKIYKHINIPFKHISIDDTTSKIINNNYEELIINYKEVKNLIKNK